MLCLGEGKSVRGRWLSMHWGKPGWGNSVAIWVVGLAIAAMTGRAAEGCPFCSGVQPTLAQLREEAIAVGFGEAGNLKGDEREFKLIQLLKSPRRAISPKLATGSGKEIRNGSLALLIASGDAKAEVQSWSWSARRVTETSFAYVAQAPDLRKAGSERLRYFAKFLEHPEGLIATDAYNEFGQAPFEEVAKVAELIPPADLRRWLADPEVAETRKGLYGLLLGLAKSPAERKENLKLLRQRIESPAGEFRAGFDGELAGFLLLTGKEGVAEVADRFLRDKKARTGDARHALAALRFFHEQAAPAERGAVEERVRAALERPELAAATLADLARWKHWKDVRRVGELYFHTETSDGPTRRAVVGYLRACPLEEAKTALAELRRRDPEGVARAEQAIELTDE